MSNFTRIKDIIENYEKDKEGTRNFSEKEIMDLYKIVYSDNVEFSSPNPHQKRIYCSNLANDVINSRCVFIRRTLL